jgi:hypothetical protein
MKRLLGDANRIVAQKNPPGACRGDRKTDNRTDYQLARKIKEIFRSVSIQSYFGW